MTQVTESHGEKQGGSRKNVTSDVTRGKKGGTKCDFCDVT